METRNIRSIYAIFFFLILLTKGSRLLTEQQYKEKCIGNLKMTYKIDTDPDNICGIKSACEFFSGLTTNHIAIDHSMRGASAQCEYYENEKEFSETKARKLDLGGGFKGFSASASMEGSNTSTRNTKSIKIENDIASKNVKVLLRSDYVTLDVRASHISATVKSRIDNMRNEDIERDFGVFMAKSCTFGAIARSSYVMDRESGSTKDTIKQELEAKYSGGLFCCNMKASNSTDISTKNKEVKIKTKFNCSGGDTNILLGANSSNNIAELKTRWAASVTPDNFYAMEFELIPLWEIIRQWNPRKADGYKSYLETKWQNQLTEIERLNARKSCVPRQLTKEEEKEAEFRRKFEGTAVGELFMKCNKK